MKKWAMLGLSVLMLGGVSSVEATSGEDLRTGVLILDSEDKLRGIIEEGVFFFVEGDELDISDLESYEVESVSTDEVFTFIEGFEISPRERLLISDSVTFEYKYKGFAPIYVENYEDTQIVGCIVGMELWR